MKIDLVTLFPEMAEGYLGASMLGRARKGGLLETQVLDLRAHGIGRHQIVDDRPFGGGAGMLLMPDPLFSAIEAVESPDSLHIYLAPDGEVLTTELARELSVQKHLVLVSGHYEGIDERVRSEKIHREISIGDYVLTNGTLPALVLIDCLARQIPGVLGEEKSLTQDSFSDSLLSFPQYTRPADFRGLPVPEVLLSGDHGAIERWRREQQLHRTRQRRPDLLAQDFQFSTDADHGSAPS
ncbi:MAG: tRNA (guanosine(37)-N1)-methyltransferase TrmD [Opitutales bacterium]